MITRPETLTVEVVRDEMASLLHQLKQNPDIYLLGDLFISRDYTQSMYHFMRNKFKSDSEIAESTKKIKDILEHRLVKGAVSGVFNPAMTKFNLMHNYGWREKSDQNLTVSGKDGEPLKWVVEVVKADKDVSDA